MLKKNRGFTLLELLIVLTLLAILSGAALYAYEGLEQQAQYDVVRYEMAEIRQALRQFRRDSGTNDFPGQGKYDCTSAEMADIAKANDPAGPDTWPIGAPSADTNLSNWQQWCQHPANFWMLFINPRDEDWNKDTKRGWNGPYLQRKSGYLDIGDDLSTTGTGSPFAGNLVENVWAIASPFIPKDDNYPLTWSNFANPNTDGYKEYKKAGTPYFVFDLDDDDDNNSDSEARIVSMGADHTYNSSEKDAPNCQQELDLHENPIDLVLCLLR